MSAEDTREIATLLAEAQSKNAEKDLEIKILHRKVEILRKTSWKVGGCTPDDFFCELQSQIDAGNEEIDYLRNRLLEYEQTDTTKDITIPKESFTEEDKYNLFPSALPQCKVHSEEVTEVYATILGNKLKVIESQLEQEKLWRLEAEEFALDLQKELRKPFNETEQDSTNRSFLHQTDYDWKLASLEKEIAHLNDLQKKSESKDKELCNVIADLKAEISELEEMCRQKGSGLVDVERKLEERENRLKLVEICIQANEGRVKEAETFISKYERKSEELVAACQREAELRHELTQLRSSNSTSTAATVAMGKGTNSQELEDLQQKYIAQEKELDATHDHTHHNHIQLELKLELTNTLLTEYQSRLTEALRSQEMLTAELEAFRKDKSLSQTMSTTTPTTSLTTMSMSIMPVSSYDTLLAETEATVRRERDLRKDAEETSIQFEEKFRRLNDLFSRVVRQLTDTRALLVESEAREAEAFKEVTNLRSQMLSLKFPHSVDLMLVTTLPTSTTTTTITTSPCVSSSVMGNKEVHEEEEIRRRRRTTCDTQIERTKTKTISDDSISGGGGGSSSNINIDDTVLYQDLNRHRQVHDHLSGIISASTSTATTTISSGSSTTSTEGSDEEDDIDNDDGDNVDGDYVDVDVDVLNRSPERTIPTTAMKEEHRLTARTKVRSII